MQAIFLGILFFPLFVIKHINPTVKYNPIKIISFLPTNIHLFQIYPITSPCLLTVVPSDL